MPDYAEKCVPRGGAPGNYDGIANGIDELDDVNNAKCLCGETVKVSED